MYIMYADEADQDGQREYLIAAAIFVPAEQVKGLTEAVELARTSVGLLPGDNLKFGSGSRPSDRISFADHRTLKNKILTLAHEHGVEVCCYVCPHDIASKQDTATRMTWAANTLLGKFDQYLGERDEAAGIALFDRTTDYGQHDHFVDVFQQGLPFSSKRVRLTRVAGICQSANGSSHLSSVCDIVCGACRYAINEPQNEEAGRALLRSVSKMMWGVPKAGGGRLLRERGFVVRPRHIRHMDYEANVQSLIERMYKYIREV